MALLLRTFLLVLCWYSCLVESKTKLVRCTDSVESKPSFSSSSDGVAGRYLLEWCTNVSTSAQRWNVHLYNTSGIRETVHSSIKEKFSIDLGCPVIGNKVNICLSKSFDLVFNSTYRVHMFIYNNYSTLDSSNYEFNIINKYTPETFIGTEKPSTTISTNYEDQQTWSLVWYFGSIPLSDYTINLCPETHDSNEGCTPLQENCTLVNWYAIQCEVWLRHGHCRLELSHTAPWINGELADKIVVHPYDESLCTATRVPQPPKIVKGWGATWWVVGGVVGCVLVVGGLMLCGRSIYSSRSAQWNTKPGAPSDAELDPMAPPSPLPSNSDAISLAPSSVLVVYARDCEPLKKIVDCLIEVLRASGMQVWDIHAPQTVAAEARGGAARGGAAGWLRARAGARGARVLVVQTALLKWLYMPNSDTGECALGSRVRYRAARYSDAALLPAAVAHLCSLREGAPYYNYFITTIEGETVYTSWLNEIATPLRLLSIPSGASELFQGLIGTVPSENVLRRLEDAVDEYKKYTDKPDYHMEFLTTI